jgi:phenylpyruvate tautomerase PptA (4-oxalocrotonate tautomerase family)
VDAEGVPVTDMTWVLVHEVAQGGWGERGVQTAGEAALPIVEICTPVGWVGMARKRKMIEDVSRGAAEGAGVEGVHYVVIHEIADGGWGYRGTQVTRAFYSTRAAPDLPDPLASPVDGEASRR